MGSMTERAPSRAAIGAALAAVYFFWGTTYLAIRVAVETIPPFLMASIRFLIAGAILYPIAVRMGDREGDRPTRRHWRSAVIIGTALLLGGNGLVTAAERTIDSGIAALMVATVPLWLVVFGRVVLRDRISGREWLGIAAGLVGLALLVNPTGVGALDPVGGGLLVLAPMAWAAGSLYARRAPLPSRPLVGTAMEMLAGGAVLGIVGVAIGELGRLDLAAISAASLVSVAYLVVFGSILAFSAYVWLLRVTRTSLAGTYAYVNPVVAVLLGWAILDERVTLQTLLAGGVIVAAVALIVTARSPRPEPDAFSESGSTAVGEPEDVRVSA